MSNARKWTRAKSKVRLSREVRAYAAALARTGMEEREVARAAIYAQTNGLDSLSGEGCLVFDEPTCGDWNCLNPSHQRFKQ